MWLISGVRPVNRIWKLAVLVLVLTGCGQSEPPGTSQPPAQPLAVGGTLPVQQLHGESLANPRSASWNQYAEHLLELSLAPPVHPSVNLRYEADTPPLPVYLQAASDGERLHIRLRWLDDGENKATTRTRFADAAAVQFALDGGAGTSFMMGAPNAPVNIWYWKAGSDQVENLAAGGFGSTTVLPIQGLEASAGWQQGEWVVVFSRSLVAGEQHQVNLAERPALFSVALWQGESGQRDGLKHVSMGWINLGGGQ